MNLKDLDLAKLSKLTSDYIDEIKCLECCKYFIAPATATCGHTLCHTCWRGRRSCPTCSASLERKSLKLNLPLQNLTNRIQALGEAFEKLFNIKLDEFELDSPEGIDLDKDPSKNVKDWLTSSQNHFSAPVHNSEPFSQDSQQPQNPLEISASNIIIHADGKKAVSPSKMIKAVHLQQPQDDWDKIEPMPEVEDVPKSTDNIVGPMDIEPFFMDENEYTTDNPRRSGRKRDVKQNDSHQKAHDNSSHKQNSRGSSCENDKKSEKGKQTWNNVKRMRKEFSKLNKKNRNKLNVSIEMVKKTQNLKAVSNTPVIPTQQVLSIDDNTPTNTDKDSETINNNSNQPSDKKQDAISNNKIIDIHTDSNKITDDPNSMTVFIQNDNNNINNKGINKHNITSSKKTENLSNNQVNFTDIPKMPFIRKSALAPKNIECMSNNIPNDPEEQTVLGNSDDIEISIKIGNTITNILIKKKNDVQVKIKTDREVQTSLESDNLIQNQTLATDNPNKYINIENNKNNAIVSQISVDKKEKSTTTQVTSQKEDKSTTGKKNTASADTATAPPFEITESVEKELSNIMEYETVPDTDLNKNTAPDNVQPIASVHVDENIEHLDDLQDLDIFNSGSVKEANVQLLKDHAQSEILTSTNFSKVKTPKFSEKRNRENTDENVLPEMKKAKMGSPKTIKDKSILPDSENYDVIMGQVFASIDADIEDIRKSQDTQDFLPSTEKNKKDQSKSKDLSEAQKTQIIKKINRSNTQQSTKNVEEYFNEKHSENVFSILEKEDENSEMNKTEKIPQQMEELLTPVVRRNLDSSQESNDGIEITNKSKKKNTNYDSDRSVVEETPQKDISIPKLKRASTSNLSQIGCNETVKPAKVASLRYKSVINLTDSVRESNKSSKDVTLVENETKKLSLETPLTISKFADHIIHKSTPVARKSLNFNNENKDDDPEQTLCPTSEVVAKNTQEKEFMSKAFEKTPSTPVARPLMSRNISIENKKYCLAGSCLNANELAYVRTLCLLRKWTYASRYTDDVTHLVVGVDEEKRSQRSVKYMSALSASKWIVTFEWVTKCMQDEDYIDEEPFEALDSTGEPGPRRSRLSKKKLFEGIKFFCMPPFSVLDLHTLKNMLTAAGGQVVKELKDVRVSPNSPAPALLLAEPENTQEDRYTYLAMEQSLVPVNYEWALNCLGSYTLSSIYDLLLCPSSLLSSVTIRWPTALIAQDYD